MTFPNTSLKLRFIAVCAVLAIVGIALVLTTTTRADSSGADAAIPVFPPAVAADQAAAAQDAFQAQFGLLRGSAADGIPVDSVIRDPGIDRSAAREVVPAAASELAEAGATSPEATVWVAPRDDGTECLLAQPADAQGPAESCATLEQASAGYLLMTQSRSESDVDLYGLVPDGVQSVTVTFGDRTTTTLPVTTNAYSAHFNKPTAAVTFIDANSVEHSLVAGIDG